MRTVLTAIFGSGIEIGLCSSAPFRLIPIRLMRTKLLLRVHSACVPSAARAARAALGVFVMQPGRVPGARRTQPGAGQVAARSDRAAEAERSSVLFKMAELLLYNVRYVAVFSVPKLSRCTIVLVITLFDTLDYRNSVAQVMKGFFSAH